MLKRAALGLGCVIWLAATALLALTDADQLELLRIIAAVYLGLPGFVLLLHTLLSIKPNWRALREARLVLRAAVVEVANEGFRGDIAKLSLHAWVLPSWYRLLPFRWRRKPKPDVRPLPTWMRPRLHRLASYRLEERGESGITFRKGIGIVGRCVDLNEDEIQIVRLDAEEYREALGRGEEKWDDEDVAITQNLKYSQAVQLSKVYGQVAALPLRSRRGDAIGCVTLDLPPGARRLKDKPQRRRDVDPLLRVLRTTTVHMSRMLTR